MSAIQNSSKQPRVCIIGGGLAGIACAAALAEHDFQVDLYETRKQLGGRAGSYYDQSSDELIDNCQHVSMGCCTNLNHLCTKLGIAEHFVEQKRLHFVSPDNQITDFQESILPAPFHLAISFWRLPYLTLREKLLFAKGIKTLAKEPHANLSGQNLYQWLRDHGQTPELIKRVWEIVLVSSLSESLDRVDAAYARKVFFDGFLSNRNGWRVEIPNESLDSVYSEKASKALTTLGAAIHSNCRLKQIEITSGLVSRAMAFDNDDIVADEYVLAIPHHQIEKLLPVEEQNGPIFQPIKSIETAPISSVHLWLDKKITELDHAVFVEKFSQWMFYRKSSQRNLPQGAAPESVYRYQIVISASRDLAHMTHDQIVAKVVEELQEVWDAAADAKLLHSRVITERRAVFSVTPGVDQLRPAQSTHLPNLFLAGDWTATGWPATMEGAVRSGYLAAESILKKHGHSDRVVASDLKQSLLSRLIFGSRDT